MRVLALLLVVATFPLAACDAPFQPVGTSAGDPEVPPDAAFHHDVPGHLNAAVERLWAENRQWGFVRPRPPGLGAPAHVPVNAYQIAPVDPTDPLSEPLVPVFPIAGRDHVFELPRNSRGTFRAVARTVPVLHPGFNPFDCTVIPLAEEHRVAWRWIDPAPPPCGMSASVFAVDLNDDGCLQPLTSVDRVLQADELGLVALLFPPEDPWPFAIRPLTEAGSGPAGAEAPACVTGD